MLRNALIIDIDNMAHGEPLTTLFAETMSLKEKLMTAIENQENLMSVFSNYYVGPNYNSKSTEQREEVAHMQRAFSRLFALLKEGFLNETVVLEKMVLPIEFEHFTCDVFAMIAAFELLHDMFDFYFECGIGSSSEFESFSTTKWFLYSCIKLGFLKTQDGSQLAIKETICEIEK